MDLFVIIFLLIVLWGIKPTSHNRDYIGRETTTAIKGIFAIIILFQHSGQYILHPNPEDQTLNLYRLHETQILFRGLLQWIGQLMVVMFLTYSGYGIMESYKENGSEYRKGFFKKRILKTLFHFDIAVAFFLILAIILGHIYPIQNYILSWIGWLSLGNSNWFIFDIIILYLMSYIVLIIVEQFHLNIHKYVWSVFCLTFLFCLIMTQAKRGQFWWYDTVLAFPAGMVWSAYKSEIESKLSKPINYILALIFTAIIFYLSYYAGHHYKVIFDTITSVAFAFLVILITMKLKIGNSILNWLGLNAFSIYILQRLSMIVCREYGINETPWLFACIVIPSTLIIAWMFTKLTNRLDRKIFS